MLSTIKHALVVEDDEALRGAVARIVSRWGARVSQAGTVAEAKSLLCSLPSPELVILDIRLPDETAFGLIDRIAELSPSPLVVAMSGKASPDEAFRLGQRGVRGYLAKPFSSGELESEVEKAAKDPPRLDSAVTARVGHVPMRELQRDVRRLMVTEALAKTEGNRSGAARLLHVTRQAVQQIVRSESSCSESAPDRKGSGN